MAETTESAAESLGKLLSEVEALKPSFVGTGIDGDVIVVFLCCGADASLVPSSFRGFEVEVVPFQLC